MTSFDLAVVFAYFIACATLGVRLRSRTRRANDYFLADRDLPSWSVTLSIVATETSAVTFLSVPGIAYQGDLTYLQLPLGYVLARALVALILLPLYFRGEVLTAYQVLERRFGGATRRVASALFLITRNLGAGLRLLLAAKVLQLITGQSPLTCAAAVTIATLIYTYIGGLKAVVWTDVLQFAVYMLTAAIALFLLQRDRTGGWTAVWSEAATAGKLQVFDFSPDLSKPYTFWAGMIGGLVLDTGTHGADHMMVQRYLAARSQKEAARALILSGPLILAQFAMFLVLGLGLWSHFRHAVLPPDQEFATYIVREMPSGVRGLAIAAVFSVTMSTLSGSISSSASAAVNDFYRAWNPLADDRRILRISKGLTAFWALIPFGIAACSQHLKDHVVNNALAVASFATGILLGLFLLALISRGIRQTSALIGSVAGLLVVGYLKFGAFLPSPFYPFAKSLAWPWYGLVGSSTVVLVGVLASFVESEKSKP